MVTLMGASWVASLGRGLELFRSVWESLEVFRSVCALSLLNESTYACVYVSLAMSLCKGKLPLTSSSICRQFLQFMWEFVIKSMQFGR